MNPLHGVFLVLIGMGAGFIQRVSGFGLGIFAMMFLPHFLPTHTAAAAISGLFSCVTSTFNTIRYRRDIAFKTALPMTLAALVTIPLAVYFSAAISGRFFEVMLGAVLIALSLYFPFFNKAVTIRPTVTGGLLAGAISGVLNGLFSTGGPPAVLYLTCATDGNITYFATIQFFFCFTNLYATAMRIFSGDITKTVLLYFLVGVVGCMTGDFIGGKVFGKLDAGMLKKIIYIGMIVSGVLMFL